MAVTRRWFKRLRPRARLDGAALVASITNDRYLERIQSDLLTNILPFWLDRVPDFEAGGFFGEIADDLTVDTNAPRGSLLTSRILWTFSAAYERYPQPSYLRMAEHAYTDLLTRFWDADYGGLFWSIGGACGGACGGGGGNLGSRSSILGAGSINLDARKQIYAQAFGIYGLSEYYRVTANPDVLELAIQLFRLVQKYSYDSVHGGFLEAFTREWDVQPNPSKSAMELYGCKSQNTQLHVLEAYTNLFGVWPNQDLRQVLFESVEIMTSRMFDAKSQHLYLFQDADWKPVSRAISLGHDIEASWLLIKAAALLGDDLLLSKTKDIALQIAEAVFEEGIARGGGLFIKPYGPELGEWWIQAEALPGFINAYQLSGDAKFLLAALRLYDFIEINFIDRARGDWFRHALQNGFSDNSARRSGSCLPTREAKVSFWKCPYHSSRACFEALDRLGSIAGQQK